MVCLVAGKRSSGKPLCVLADFQMPSAQNNPHTRVAYFGVAQPELLHQLSVSVKALASRGQAPQV